MNETASHDAGPHDDILKALRQRVLGLSLTILAVAMPIISVILGLGALYSGTLSVQLIIMASAMVVFPLLRYFSPLLGNERSAVALVAFLAASAFLLASQGGLTVGYAALCVMVLQLSTLFFMRRGAWAGLVTVLTLHVAGWLFFTNGIGGPIALLNWDPYSNAVWIRHLVVLGLLGLAIARGQLYVVEQLAESVVRYRDLARRETAQRLALEHAEREQARDREQRARAQQALERSRRTEALARVAGGVAHDFNNALTIILGAAEAARESPDEADIHLAGIIDAARHASALTTQLLTLGHNRLSAPAQVPVAAFLARFHPSCAPVLPDDVVLTVEMPETALVVHVDQTGLERALFNLVLNARDAMPRGGHIVISASRALATGADERLAPGPYVVLQVSDGGVGMDQETLDQIFDLFFTTKGDKGTGLGLASVHAFAEESGGAVDVTSTPGGGTRVTLWLPEVPTERVTAAVLPASPGALATLEGRVLVVDDLPELRAMMTRVLSRRGLDVVSAADGDAALTLLQAGPRFSLMCIDGVMPGLSTATTIDLAHQMAPDLQVLVCSGHVQEDLLRRGIETGRYELLQKPFTSDELIGRVSRALEQAKALRTD